MCTVGFNYFSDLYQVLEMIDTLQTYHNNVSEITHLPTIFLSSVLWERRNELVAMELSYIVFSSHLGYSTGVFQAFWLVVLAVFWS